MRIAIAGLIGGIIVFIWGFLAHVVLPIGEMGFQPPNNEDVVLSAFREGLPASRGVYFFPYLAPEARQDEAAVAAWTEKSNSQPYALVIYNPQGGAQTTMGDNLGIQFVSDVLAAGVVAFVLALGPFGFGRRVLIAGAIGLFSWLALSVPYWNWYQFPTDFTVGALIGQVVGWLLGGAGIAWWLGRGEH